MEISNRSFDSNCRIFIDVAVSASATARALSPDTIISFVDTIISGISNGLFNNLLAISIAKSNIINRLAPIIFLVLTKNNAQSIF